MRKRMHRDTAKARVERAIDAMAPGVAEQLAGKAKAEIGESEKLLGEITEQPEIATTGSACFAHFSGANLMDYICTQEESPMNTELVMTMFDGEEAASAAYEALRRLEQNGGIAILDAATLVKHGDGTSEIKDTQDVDTHHGAYFGVISGALIGLLGGPAGALIGSVAGAATGAASASLIDLGFPKADLQVLDEQLAPGSSALVVLIEATWLDKLDDALASFAGRSTSRSLHSDRADRIAAAAEAIEQELAELRLEDERGWAALLADFDADLARMDAQLAQESDLIRGELNAEAQAEADLAELRDRRDAKRQELEEKIQARIDRLNATI